MRVEASTETQVAPKSFEEQFNNPLFVEVNGAQVKVVNLIPEHHESNVPLLLAPGWSETTDTYKNSLKHIYDQNNRVISLDHPRHGGIPEKYKDIPRAELAKAQNTIAAIEQSGLKKVDAITHSEASIYVGIAASLRPDLFRNIVFVSPTGMLLNDNLLKETGRFGSLSVREGASLLHDKVRLLSRFINSNIRKRLGKEVKPYVQGKYKEGMTIEGKKTLTYLHTDREIPNPDSPQPHDIGVIKYVIANPKRTLAEAHAITKSNIFESIEKLRELGIGITIVHGVDDPLEPTNAIFEAAAQKGEMDSVDGKRKMPTDGYYSVTHGHNTLARDERYVNAALDALKGLAQKSENKQTTP